MAKIDLTQPMLKQGGVWKEVDWQTALEYVANGLKNIRHDHGAESIGALVSPAQHRGRVVFGRCIGTRLGQ